MERINTNNTTFLITTINKSTSEIVEIIKKNKLVGVVLVGCQGCTKESVEHIQCNDVDITIYYENTVGTSVNRNFLLSKVNSDFCFFFDDDITFLDRDFSIINEAVNKYNDFDLIFFDFKYSDPSRKKVKWRLSKRIKPLQLRSYGTNSILYRVDFIKKNKLLFNESIGPGCYIYAGEDGQFSMSAAKLTKKRFSFKKTIISISYEEGSTWFKGYNDRFFQTIGYTYRMSYGKMAYLLSIFTIIKHKKDYLSKLGWRAALQNVRKGIKKYAEE